MYLGLSDNLEQVVKANLDEEGLLHKGMAWLEVCTEVRASIEEGT